MLSQTRRGRLAGAALTAVLLALGPATAALADGSGTGSGQVTKAKAAATAKADQLAAAQRLANTEKRQLNAAKAAVVSAQQQLTTLAATARAAIDRYNAAMVVLGRARATARVAEAALAVAEQKVAVAQDAVNRFVAATYMSGGPLASVATVLQAGGPGQVLDQSATLEQISRWQGKLLAALAEAKGQQAVAANTANTALEAVARSAAQVDATRRAAVRAMSDQEKLLGSLTRQQADLAGRLSAQKAHVATLAKQHLAAVEAAALAEQRQALLLAWQSLEAAQSSLPVATAKQGRDALAWATKELGVPYSWGGGDANGPTLGFAENKAITAGAHTVGFDCSGLTLFAWAHEGFTIDHYTGYQWLEGRHISLDELRAGDLVFFATDVSDPLTIHHVGMYAGNGLMIDAPETGAVVRYDKVFIPGLIGAVRP